MNLTNLELTLIITNVLWIVAYTVQYRTAVFFRRLAMGWMDNAIGWKKALDTCESLLDEALTDRGSDNV